MYQCETCKISYTRKTNLTRHQRNVHGCDDPNNSLQQQTGQSTTNENHQRNVHGRDDTNINLQQETGQSTTMENQQIISLSQRILNAIEIPVQDIALLRENYTKHPNLALVYYHLCSGDPNAFVFNDETLEGLNGEKVCKRISNAMGQPIGQDEAIMCQKNINEHLPSTGKIGYCASCNEFLVEPQDQIYEVLLQDLPEDFELTTDQIEVIKNLNRPALISKHMSVLKFNNRWYHLNPDLIPDVHKGIVLCCKCRKNPLDYEYSLANGHDYGRIGSLPHLNDVTLNAIIPVRPFNISIVIRENHSTGHAICFPCDGPIQIAHMLPEVSSDRRLRVTFLTKQDSWRKSAKRFRKLFDINVIGAYRWLDTWVGLGNQAFEHVSIDVSFETKELMANEVNMIEDESIVSVNNSIAKMSEYLDEVMNDQEIDNQTEGQVQQSNNDVDLDYSTVLPKPSLADQGINTALQVILKIIHPNEDIAADFSNNNINDHDDSKCEDIESDSNSMDPDDTSSDSIDSDDVNLVINEEVLNKKMDVESKSLVQGQVPIAVITRDSDPICEWDENDIIMRGAFPHLFLLGKGLPKGPMSLRLSKHLSKFYDSRFDDYMFTSVQFNQIQRAACIRKTAQITIKHTARLKALGKLANSDTFRKRLEWARDHPFSDKAKALNSKMCHILSMVGGTVPFSPFERTINRPHLSAMRLRYGTASQWLTIAPPEFEDLSTLRLSLIKKWNDPNCVISQRGFLREMLPDNIKLSAFERLKLTRLHPGLAALSYKWKIKSLFNDILRCPQDMDTRISRNYTERERGAYAELCGVNMVHEPQTQGRLHGHLLCYGSVLTPSLLTRLAAAPNWLKEQVAKHIESLQCNHVSQFVRDWYSLNKSKISNTPMPRAADIIVPSADDDYAAFILAAEKKQILTGEHTHGFTCEKPPKGRYMCRLAVDRGVHTDPTCPLIVILHKSADHEKHQHAIVQGIAMEAETIRMLNTPYKPLQGQLIRPHPMGPIVWELKRPKSDSMLIEANHFITNLLGCHNCSSIINGQDAGESIEEYMINYMSKYDSPLKQAASVMLASIDAITIHPSIAEDSGSMLRTGKHLAHRTVNAFSGAHQWSMPLMKYALLGHTSHTGTESFRYVFPHANTAFIDKFPRQEVDQNNTQRNILLLERDKIVNDERFVDKSLEELHNAIDSNRDDIEYIGGTCSYKLETGKIVFVTAAESYQHRGGHFEQYSRLEFECIVELTKVKKKEGGGKVVFRRPTRATFVLGSNHLLFPEYVGVLRHKMKTPILAGRPPPKFPGNKPIDTILLDHWHEELHSFSKYVIDLIVPDQMVPSTFTRDGDGLLQLIDQWDRFSTPLLNRQRFRFLSNLMSQMNHCARNQLIVTEWRERNTQWWYDLGSKNKKRKELGVVCNDHLDPDDAEAKGRICPSELHDWTNAACDLNIEKEKSYKRIRLQCNDIFGSGKNCRGDCDANSNINCSDSMAVIFLDTCGDPESFPLDLNRMHKQIKNLVKENLDVNDDLSNNKVLHSTGAVDKILNETDITELQPCDLSGNQLLVSSAVLNAEGQILLFMTGGGGTGKTTVIKIIHSVITKQRCEAVNCSCYTGVGASKMPEGQTFSRTWRTWLKTLNAGNNITEMKRAIGGDKLKIVIVDEVSMLCATFLLLLDDRLRSMYDCSKMFGGISVLLVGDFLQLPVVNGIDLYHVLYSAIKGDDVKAANLFSHFQVVELETQRRAADSLDHTRRLELFRALPIRYPLGPRWDALDSAYKPLLVDDLLEAVTKEITYNDVLEDETWITQSTILTTNNADHAVLNAERASIYARYFGRIVLKWRRVIRKELPLCLQELLYNSDKHPELFAYFVIGAPAQILDNGNGNVLLRVANGTMCTMYKLAWNNELDTQNASKAIREAVLSNKLIADVPTPDYIIVSIKRHPDYSWPTDLDLSPTNPEVFTIPIGLDSRQEKNHLCIASSRIKVHYIAHAVDLAFAITVWKSQGGEYDKIVLLLEPSKPGPALNYHLLYTAFSRVKLASGYRCLPITSSKVRIALGQLRPNIYSVKYRMSISEKGYWYKHKRDKSAPKCSKQSKVLKAKIANNSIVSVNRYCDDNFQSNTRIPSLTTDVRNIRNSKRKHCATVTCNNMDSVPTRKDTRSGLSLQMDTVSINEENIMYASTRSLNAHLVTNSPDDEHNPQIEEILYENEINRTKLASTLVSFEMDSVSMNEENMAHVSNQVETIGRTLNGAIVSNSPKNESDLQINQILYDNHINSVIQASLPFQRVAVIGFSNVGNSCYINAIVQMFNLVVLSIPDTDVQNSNRTPIADTFMNLINTLRKTVSIFWDRQEQLCKQLIQLLGFSQEQQDAHEAAIKLVELLPTMFLHQFGFTTEYTLECSCNHISVQKCKNESILPIQIIYRIHETVPSLRTLLTHYLQPERLTDYICGQCSRLGTTIKSVKIANGKMFISFQLVRFYTSEEGITKKYCGKVIVSKYILINHVTYKLVAAILHHGDSMEDGHYTTIICDTKMHYNDGRISKISNIDDKIANNSYILLFQKINS